MNGAQWINRLIFIRALSRLKTGFVAIFHFEIIIYSCIRGLLIAFVAIPPKNFSP